MFTFQLLFIYLFNQVSDLKLQWQLNQSIAQSKVGLKQSTRLQATYKPPIITS